MYELVKNNNITLYTGQCRTQTYVEKYSSGEIAQKGLINLKCIVLKCNNLGKVKYVYTKHMVQDP